MPYYKDLSGELHFLEQEQYEYLLPEGCKQIKNSEADAIQKKNGEQSDEQLAKIARVKRDGLLLSCDWTQMPDSPLNDSEKMAWKNYRQCLRDIPLQSGFPANIVWPDL